MTRNGDTVLYSADYTKHKTGGWFEPSHEWDALQVFYSYPAPKPTKYFRCPITATQQLLNFIFKFRSSTEKMFHLVPFTISRWCIDLNCRLRGDGWMDRRGRGHWHGMLTSSEWRLNYKLDNTPFKRERKRNKWRPERQRGSWECAFSRARTTCY